MLTHDAPHALTLRDIVINRSLDLGEAPLDIVAPTTGSCNTHQTGKYIERFILQPRVAPVIQSQSSRFLSRATQALPKLFKTPHNK